MCMMLILVWKLSNGSILIPDTFLLKCVPRTLRRLNSGLSRGITISKSFLSCWNVASHQTMQIHVVTVTKNLQAKKSSTAMSNVRPNKRLRGENGSCIERNENGISHPLPTMVNGKVTHANNLNFVTTAAATTSTTANDNVAMSSTTSDETTAAKNMPHSCDNGNRNNHDNNNADQLPGSCTSETTGHNNSCNNSCTDHKTDIAQPMSTNGGHITTADNDNICKEQRSRRKTAINKNRTEFSQGTHCGWMRKTEVFIS
jgi:hypothetical protein